MVTDGRILGIGPDALRRHLRRQLSDTEAKRQKMAERLSRVEALAEHAHRRLDAMEQRQPEQGGWK